MGSGEHTAHLAREAREARGVGSARRAPRVRASLSDRLLAPLHRLVWRDARRRAAKLLAFAETEADGGRDIARAAELTGDGHLRRLYLRHALDEARHASMFRHRARTMLAELPAGKIEGASAQLALLGGGERGVDDLRVDGATDASLLAFLHLSERAAAARFGVYCDVLADDPETRDVFEAILRDEVFHMNYTLAQLRRVNPKRHGLALYWARATRLGRAYLRVSAAIAQILGGVMLTLQYFLVLPLFAWLAKRAARSQRAGWVTPSSRRSLSSGY